MTGLEELFTQGNSGMTVTPPSIQALKRRGTLTTCELGIFGNIKKKLIRALTKNTGEAAGDRRALALRAFQTIDKDGSGTIGHDELGALLEDMGLTFETEVERNRVVTAAVEALDADLSGEISEEEFVTWISS